jgi:hypothetical protein
MKSVNTLGRGTATLRVTITSNAFLRGRCDCGEGHGSGYGSVPVTIIEALSSIYRLTSVRTTQPLTLPPGHEPAETNWTGYKSTYTFSVNVVP